jgi:hypothetical protein
VSKVLLAVGFAFLCTFANAQTTPPCTVSEGSIFHEARVCGKSREGSLRKSDLTVVGFSIGDSTLEDVAKRFPGSHQFRLSKAMEAGTGICVQNERGEAVVFSSGDLAEPKILDSIYMARAETFERQGAKCLKITSFPNGASTESGIRLGMEKGRVLALLRIPKSTQAKFEVDYTTSPGKAPWVTEKSKPKDSQGWTAMSGVYGEFRNGRLRWIVFYGGVSG